MFGNIFEGSIAPIAVKAIGETARLTDVDFVPAIAVDVAHRNAVVAVDIDSRRGIETRRASRVRRARVAHRMNEPLETHTR